jgi:carboxypeptidase C (cathepsin A)
MRIFMKLHTTRSALLLAALVQFSFAPPTLAEDASHEEAHQPVVQRTEHSIRIDGERIDYRADVGWMIQTKDDAPVARFGYTAYFRQGVETGERPILFAFNGGPGSSSIWLHMGVLGPQRVVVNDGGHTPPPPARRVDNAYSILDVADLVMIDPVGTGFSRPIGEAEGKDFWGVDQDIESVARFIKDYISDQGRWASPKFILGESYGGIRAAGLAHHLQSRHGMHLNGVILVSPFMSVHAGRDGYGMELPHALFFPAFAATAWYHDLLDPKPADFDAFIEEVEAFAMNEYLPALQAGFTIDPERKRAIARQLAEYTATDPQYWMLADLRVDHQEFLQELQRDDRIITGRIDSRLPGRRRIPCPTR